MLVVSLQDLRDSLLESHQEQAYLVPFKYRSGLKIGEKRLLPSCQIQARDIYPPRCFKNETEYILYSKQLYVKMMKSHISLMTWFKRFYATPNDGTMAYTFYMTLMYALKRAFFVIRRSLL